jgi:nuclear transport factor 2 (NTF2) superfamily protein
VQVVRVTSLKPPLVAESAAQMLQLATAMEARNSLAAPQVAYSFTCRSAWLL